MKFFIDSADIEQITDFYNMGIADGVTTNPSLLQKAVSKRRNVNLKKYISDILKIAKNTPVSLEVEAIDYKEMVRQGKALYKVFNPVAKNVFIKIPVNPACTEDDETHFDGIRAIRELSKAKIPINTTLVFTPEQALLAAKAGAKIISPFTGRVDDFIRVNAKKKFEKTDYFPQEGVGKNDNGIVSGIELVKQCVDITKKYNTEILAASIRNPRQLREAALAGAHIATLPYGVIEQMNKHFKTFEGNQKFFKDFNKEYINLTK